MDAEQFIVPAPHGSAYEEITLTSPRQATGISQWRKHILSLGTLIHPQTGERLTLDEPWYDRLKANFDAQVCPTVALPLANDSNKHVEDPLRNGGEVIGLERQGRKIFAVLDVRKPEVDAGLRDRTILDSSAFLHMNYQDTKTGQKVGPTLLHNCLTNRAYVTDLDPFEEIIAATAESADNQGDVELLLTEDEPKMDLADLKATLKADHGIDLDALQAAAGQGTGSAELVAALTQALSQSGGLQLANNVTGEDLVGAIAELAQLSRGQGEEIGQLKRERAERQVDGFISAGRLLPKSRERAVELALTRPDELDDFLAPADAPYVRMSQQAGAETGTAADGSVQNIDAGQASSEVTRLTQQDATSRFFVPASQNGKHG